MKQQCYVDGVGSARLITTPITYYSGCYCAVSVKVAMGCPRANCPSAVTCTVPGVEGRVSTTTALPEESVVTTRLESAPALGLKKIVPPAAPPPDCPGLSMTDRFSLLPARAFWSSLFL